MILSKGGIDQFILYRYRYGIGMFALFVATIFLLTFKLDTLVTGISNPEAIQGMSSDSLKEILSNPIYAPYKILQWISIKVLGTSVLALRLPSILIGAASVALLYDLFRYWHKQRIAILGSLLFVTSSWFLHFARLGTPYISLAFFVLVLLWAGTKLHHAPVRKWPFIFMAAAVAGALYVPYMLYFLIPAAIFHRRVINKHLWHLSKTQRLYGLGAFLVIILPLIYAMISDPSIIKQYLGIPIILPTIKEYLANVPATVGHVFWRSFPNPVFHLGELPMLDIFTATMAALGIYQYEKQLNQHRTKWLFVGSLVLILTLSLAAQSETFVVLAPLVYIFAATGVVALLVQWYEIFPKNPVARTIGIIPIFFLLVIVTSYHSNRYFLAWARSPETKAVFHADTEAVRQDIKNNQASRIVIVAPEDQHPSLQFATSQLVNSVVIMTPGEFFDSNITAEVTYVYRGVDLPKAVAEKLKQDGEVNSNRQIDPQAYKKFRGPDAQIRG